MYAGAGACERARAGRSCRSAGQCRTALYSGLGNRVCVSVRAGTPECLLAFESSPWGTRGCSRGGRRVCAPRRLQSAAHVRLCACVSVPAARTSLPTQQDRRGPRSGEEAPPFFRRDGCSLRRLVPFVASSWALSAPLSGPRCGSHGLTLLSEPPGRPGRRRSAEPSGLLGDGHQGAQAGGAHSRRFINALAAASSARVLTPSLAPSPRLSIFYDLRLRPLPRSVRSSCLHQLLSSQPL